MTCGERSVLILYGSETGNAQDIADELGRICQRLRWEATVDELDSAELSTMLQHKYVIFAISTTGQGDMPHNSMLFWKKLLRRKLPPGCLQQLRYTCFGLGDSTYVKFNWAARKLIRRLEQLGAETFLDPFEADEQFNDGIEGCFVQWAEKLRTYLTTQHPHPEGLQPIPDADILPAKWSLEPALAMASPLDLSQKAQEQQEPPLGAATEVPPLESTPVQHSWKATLTGKKRLTPESHWQDVQLLSFDIPTSLNGQRLECKPGDCLTVYPKNFPTDVQRLIDVMEWSNIADAKLNVSMCESLPRGLQHLSEATLRDLLLHYIDFTAVPRRSFLKSMSYFASDPDHKERLLEFTMTDYIDEYFDYATRSRRSIIEVLEEFHSVKIPPERLLDIFPLIRGRDFSIANGGTKLDHPIDASVTRVELLVAMVKYRTVLRKPRQGLCSRYLTALPAASTVYVTHKAVTTPIHGAKNAARPLLAMATGTGLAPVRALLHERQTHASSGPAMLFFGNRNRAADYFFEDEWPELNISVSTAFSRDQREKIYVQDLLKKDTESVEKVIGAKGIFAVCGGSSKMAEACKRAVTDPFIDGDDEEARRKILEDVTWWQEIW